MSVVSQNGTANCAEFLDGSAARSPTAIARRPSHRAVQINRAAWCAIVLLVIAQGILFRHHAMREIVWAYPPDHDQLTYLEESYQTYEEFLHRGIGGLAEGLGLRAGPVRLSPSSATLNLQAALIYSAAGPSRLSAISLNFFYWALFQLTFVGTVRWLTKRWSAAFLALALLLTTRSAFQLPGGLFDFRLDFIASCLFGIVICVVIRSRCFALWRWSLVAGCAAAMLATFRFITVVYLFGAFAVYLAILLLQLWRRQHDVAGRRAVARQMKGLLAGAAIFAAVTGPVLWQRREAITNYYVRGHVIGHDKELRALVAGNTTWERSLSFYPRSLLHDHLGAAFALLNSVVLALSLSLSPRSRSCGRHQLRLAGPEERSWRDHGVPGRVHRGPPGRAFHRRGQVARRGEHHGAWHRLGSLGPHDGSLASERWRGRPSIARRFGSVRRGGNDYRTGGSAQPIFATQPDDQRTRGG